MWAKVYLKRKKKRFQIVKVILLGGTHETATLVNFASHILYLSQ